MALNVISNFAANVAQRNLVMSDRAATSSLAKLSSGQRVVSAKDDAASLAIGSRLKAEVVAMRTANVNATQAGSMLQIADGAMATISDILVRMKELAVQASSGQFSDLERGILDSEYQALLEEITRISDDTEFNGQSLISGGNAVYDVGAQSATTNELAGTATGLLITFSDTSFDTTKVADEDTFRFSYDYTSSTVAALTLTNTNTGDRQTIDIAAALNTAGSGLGADLAVGESATIDFSNLGVKVVINENFTRAVDDTTEGNQAVTGLANLTVNGSINVVYADSGLTAAGIIELLAAGSYAAATGLLTIEVDTGSTDFNLGTTGSAGLTFRVDADSGAFAATVAGNLDDGAIHTIDIALAGGEILGRITLDDVDGAANDSTFIIDIGHFLFGVDYASTGTTTDFTFKVGTGNQDFDSLTFTVQAASGAALSLTGSLIDTSVNAELASTAVSNAIDTLNQSRSDVGAAQNRLTFASNNLATAIENAEAARSNLLDLDVAAEISNFTSKQILVQTGVAMLAQANQLPQNLLRLFQ